MNSIIDFGITQVFTQVKNAHFNKCISSCVLNVHYCCYIIYTVKIDDTLKQSCVFYLVWGNKVPVEWSGVLFL